MKRKILAISPVPSHPQNAGNRVRTFRLLTGLRELGHEIYFLFIRAEIGDEGSMKEYWGQDHYFSVPYQRPSKKAVGLQKLINEIKHYIDPESRYLYSIDDFYDATIDARIDELHKSIGFDTVIVTYVYMSKALERFNSRTLKLIDTQDVLTNRHRLYLEQGARPQWFSTTAAGEKKGLDRSDIVIAIQEKEKNHFESISHKRVVTISHLITLKKIHFPLPEGPLQNLLFVGSVNPINVQSIQAFIEHTMPLIVRQTGNSKLLVAGKVCEKLSDTPYCVKLGEMENIELAYAQADIVINPVSYGTGLNIKNIEALGYGMPLVTTSIGSKGLEAGQDYAYLAADNPVDFAASVVKLLTDRNLAGTLSDRAYAYAERWNQQHFAALAGLLEKECQE